MAASKVVESVILGVLTLVGISYAVTHQEELKMYWQKFVMSAQSQLSGGPGSMTGGGGMTGAAPPATGGNTLQSDNTPASVTAAPPATAPTTDNIPVTMDMSQPMFTGTTPSGPDVTALGGPQAFQQGTEIQPGGMPFTNLTSPQLNPQPSTNVGLPPTTTGRPMKGKANPIMPPRNNMPTSNTTPTAPQQNVTGDLQAGIDKFNMMKLQEAAAKMRMMQQAQAKKNTQVQNAIRSGKILVGANMANEFCTCQSGMWRGPGCNVANRYCSVQGQHGMAKTTPKNVSILPAARNQPM